MKCGLAARRMGEPITEARDCQTKVIDNLPAGSHKLPNWVFGSFHRVDLMEKRGFFHHNGKAPEFDDGEFKYLVDKWFYIPKQLLDHLLKFGPEAKYFNACLIPSTIENPLSIFQGLGRDNHEESLCYVSKPANRPRDHQVNIPFDQRFVFLVFVTKDLKVIDWDIVKCDQADELKPEDHENRFRRLIYAQQPD